MSSDQKTDDARPKETTRAMLIQTQLIKWAAANTPFNFVQGYAGDFLIDAHDLATMDTGESRFIVVGPVSTAMFSKEQAARKFLKFCGDERVLARIEFLRRPIQTTSQIFIEELEEA